MEAGWEGVRFEVGAGGEVPGGVEEFVEGVELGAEGSAEGGLVGIGVRAVGTAQVERVENVGIMAGILWGGEAENCGEKKERGPRHAEIPVERNDCRETGKETEVR